MHGMIARTQLAVLDFNCNWNNGQAKTIDGDLRYKQVFSKITQSWVVKKISDKNEKTYQNGLMIAILEVDRDLEGNKLPLLGTIPENIAPME